MSLSHGQHTRRLVCFVETGYGEAGAQAIRNPETMFRLKDIKCNFDRNLHVTVVLDERMKLKMPIPLSLERLPDSDVIQDIPSFLRGEKKSLYIYYNSDDKGDSTLRIDEEGTFTMLGFGGYGSGPEVEIRVNYHEHKETIDAFLKSILFRVREFFVDDVGVSVRQLESIREAIESL